MITQYFSLFRFELILPYTILFAAKLVGFYNKICIFDLSFSRKIISCIFCLIDLVYGNYEDMSLEYSNIVLLVLYLYRLRLPIL